jgi:hypothetical protein
VRSAGANNAPPLHQPRNRTQKTGLLFFAFFSSGKGHAKGRKTSPAATRAIERKPTKMCTCEPEVNAMNHACSNCQAEYTAWSEDLERAGIIGPYEHTREMRKRQGRARTSQRLRLEANANAAFYAAMGEIA